MSRDQDGGNHAWRLVLRALAEISGFERGVLYDVPRVDAPRPAGGTRVFLHGSPAWRRFLAARAAVDDGALTLLLSLRPLDDVERSLAVDWGSRYANSFLLVEPRDPACNLTDPTNATRRALHAAASRLLRERSADDSPDEAWTRATALGAALRDLFGAWIAWPEPYSDAPTEHIPLRLSGTEDTLRRALIDAVADRYPQECFDAALAELYERERELFGGPVARIRIPFRTRLGLPVLHDPRLVDRAVRRLVNEGRAWVFEDGPDPAFYRGPQRPVPARMTDAELERLLVR